MKIRSVLLSIMAITAFSCEEPKTPITVSVEQLHASVDKVTEIMIHDIFSPPVASRIFVYPNIAAYEIMALHNKDYISLEKQLNGLKAIPRPNPKDSIDYRLAALIAHMDLSKKLIFSEERMELLSDSLYAGWRTQNSPLFLSSKKYALQVSGHIAEWMNMDNYAQTRTMPKFTVDSNSPMRWQPTPPAYMDGIEPHWSKIRPFVINSSEQFKPIPPPPFSMEESSDFYKELKEVYDISNQITEKGDESEEIKIARFWDCNPYVSVTRGHLMFASKKITPGAHWIGIAKIASRKTKADFDKTIYAYTKTSIAIADAFISCWDEKYRSNLIRPETLINEYIDDSWKPVLQTPPFPEYTSGHSVVSGAAAIALTNIYGDNFGFEDDTETSYGMPVRDFTSFNNAADEAAISRMYGGIHYRSAVELGLLQGRALGRYIVGNLKMSKKQNTASEN